jgi:hypothetical protein
VCHVRTALLFGAGAGREIQVQHGTYLDDYCELEDGSGTQSYPFIEMNAGVVLPRIGQIQPEARAARLQPPAVGRPRHRHAPARGRRAVLVARRVSRTTRVTPKRTHSTARAAISL